MVPNMSSEQASIWQTKTRRRARMRWMAMATVVVLASGTARAEWRQFRGTLGNGVASAVRLPLEWSERERWKVELPGRGPASPIVVGDQVLLTASSGHRQQRLHVFSVDAATGARKWERHFQATGRTQCHPTSANAAPTPASDGRSVVAFFSSNDLVCLDLEGRLKWYRGLAHERPRAGNDIGMSSSPLITGDVVVVQVENQGDSFAVGVDLETGKTRWEVARPKQASWASPILYRDPGRSSDTVLLQSPWGITAHDAANGHELWRYETDCESIPSAAVDHHTVYLPSNGLTAIRPAAVTAEVVWGASQLGTSAASPLVVGNKLFTIGRAGVLNCADSSTGQLEGEAGWRLRLEGRFWASPVATGDQLLLVNSEGQLFVVDISDRRGKVISKYDLDANIQATPAVSEAGVFIRSDTHLWKFALRAESPRG